MSVSTIYSYMGATVVYLCELCTSSLDGKSVVSFTSWLLCLGKRTTSSLWIGDRVGPRPSMAILKKTQISYPLPAVKPWIIQPTVQTLLWPYVAAQVLGITQYIWCCDNLVSKLTDCQNGTVCWGIFWIPKFLLCIRSLKITQCAFVYICILTICLPTGA